MKERVYCIIQKGSNFYIPIKAKTNPYKTGNCAAYLACLPNFFGGVVDTRKNETKMDALRREVGEESQDIISLTDDNIEECKLLYQCKIGRDDYFFYLTQVKDDGKDYFSGNICELSCNNNLPKAKREMCCIIKVPVAQLKGINLDDFLEVCKSLGGDFVNIDEETDGYKGQLGKWNGDEGTKDAFASLLALLK